MAGRDDAREGPGAGEQARATPPRPDDVPPGTPGAGETTRPPSAVVSRRRRTQTLTFLVSFALIVLLGLAALAAYFDRLDIGLGSGRPAALPTCPSTAPTSQAYADTRVRVLNASTRNGLALQVVRELQKRGFQVPDAPANAPQKTPVATMAIIRHGPAGELAAKTVATVVAGAVTFQVDDRPGSDVDLVLGQTFELAPAPAPSPTAPSTAEPTCLPAP